MQDIYPWDFRSILRRFYLLRNGIYIDSLYTDCLVETYITEQFRVDFRRLATEIIGPRMQAPERYERPLFLNYISS